MLENELWGVSPMRGFEYDVVYKESSHVTIIYISML